MKVLQLRLSLLCTIQAIYPDILYNSLVDHYFILMYREIGDSISTYIETCQRYKSEVAATNVRQLIDSFNSAGVSEATDDIHQRPIISPIEAYQIVSLGLFTIEKAFLVKSLHEKFLNHQDALQSLLDGLASLAQ